MKYYKKINKLLALSIGIFAVAFTGCTASSVAIEGYPESVAEENDVYYVAIIGKTLEPTKKDGDGFIAKLDSRGKIISGNAFPNVKLNAPKGAIIEDDVLYVADIDRVVGISTKTGMQVVVYDLSKEGMSFLNDLVEEDGNIYASATDINKIFIINMRTGKYRELKTTEPLNGPNGLDIEDNTLYVAEYATDKSGKPIGKIKALQLLKTNAAVPVTVVYNVPGQYDGIKVEDEDQISGPDITFIYFSDWEMNGKPGAVKKLNLKTNEVKNVVTVPVNGPADFIIEDGKIWLPAMADKKIVIE